MEFYKQFADFLQGRIGDALSMLRVENKKYKLLLDERDAIRKTKYNDFVDLEDAFKREIELEQQISDIEINYIFLMGMREHKKFEDAPNAKEFYNEFIDFD